MEKNIERKIWFIIFIFFLFIFASCEKKKNQTYFPKLQEKITEFSVKQFSTKDYFFTLKAESAENISSDSTKISSPSLSLQTKSEIIQVNTDKEGKGEIKINPETKKISEIIITGKIKILYKDKKDGTILMEINCGKAKYIDEKREMIFEEKPQVKRAQNLFSGDIIFYNIDKNTIEIKGNVNVEIVPEK